VFKSEIVTAFNEAKAEYASIVIRTVPEPGATGAAASTVQTGTEQGKPIYKKWWFYAGVAAVLLAAVGVAGSGGGDEAQPPRDTGTVTVEVDVP
jgi:hypothetical protein